MTVTTVPSLLDAQVYGEPRLHTDGDLAALTFAPDGSVWSVEEPGVVRQWEPSTGRLLFWNSLSDLETLWCFSPDTRLLASASDDVSLWDTVRGNLRAVLPQTAWVTALGFHPAKPWLAVGDDEGGVSLWDVPSTKRLRTFVPSGGRQRAPPALERQTGRQCPRIFRLRRSPGRSRRRQTYSPWDVATGTLLGTLRGHTDRIPSLAWHPDGRFLVSVGWDRTARVWDTTTLDPVILLNSHALQLTALAFSADGRLLATADSDHAVHVWDFAAKKTLRVFKGAHQDIRSIAFSPDGSRLAFGGGDRCIHLWDPNQGKRLSTDDVADAAHISLDLSPDGKRLATSGGAGVQVWETDPVRPLLRLAEAESVQAVAYSPDNRWIAGGSLDGTVRLWNAQTGERHALWQGPDEPITSLAFSPDGKTLASASSSGLSVWLWNVDDGEPVLLIPDALDGCTVESIVFHPQGRLLAVGGIDWLATGGSNGAVCLWDLVDRCEVASFFEGTCCVALDPTGNRLAAATLEESVVVWDVPNRALIAELPRHDSSVTCLAFSPDGKLLATGAEDRTLRLWDMTLGQLRMEQELDTQVKVIRFSSDGRWLYTGNGNTTSYRFEVQKLLRNA